MAHWFAVSKLQGFARDNDGAFVSFAACAVVWGDQPLRYLFVPHHHIEGERVLFAPGAVDKALATYGLPADQDQIDATCEAALHADPTLVTAKQAEMEEQDRLGMDSLMFPCADCARVGFGKA